MAAFEVALFRGVPSVSSALRGLTTSFASASYVKLPRRHKHNA